MAKLSEFDKKAIETKRTQNAALRWEQMSAEEKTEYISRIKSGSEPLRSAMIDAWNNNPDIIVQMSVFLKKQQVKTFRPSMKISNNITIRIFCKIVVYILIFFQFILNMLRKSLIRTKRRKLLSPTRQTTPHSAEP